MLSSTNSIDEDRKDVLGKFNTFFQVRKNIIFKRARFNKRNQLERENAESYITALYELAENCDYGALKSEMIRDRLVIGIRDNALSEHLQTEEGFTIKKAKRMMHQQEAVHEQQSTCIQKKQQKS